MGITTKIAALFVCATLAVGCSKAPRDMEQGSELDWSKTSTITLGRVAMAASAKATDPPLMKEGQTFRFYAIDPQTDQIIATNTYTITGGDGIPVIDAPQNKVVALPYGVLDIFLVGPVKATLDGVEHEIAKPTEVTPMLGVDLISSRTQVTIRTKEHKIVPDPLQHRMVKLGIQVHMEQDGVPALGDLASYKNAYMTDGRHGVRFDNIGTSGTFAFDESGGRVTGTASTSCLYTYKVGNSGERNLKLLSAGVAITPGEVTGTAYAANDYIFPFHTLYPPKLTVTYGYTFRKVGGALIEAHEMSGSSPHNIVWTGGTYITYHTTLTPSIVMTVRTQILPWDDGGTTPVEPPSNANNDLLFWYSGEDAPERIDGKMCWRDRSGNGNHAVINGGMTYDAVNKCYYATTGSDSFTVPALGKVAEYTLELTAQSVNDACNNAATFSGTGGAGGLGIHLPYAPYIVYYCPESIQYAYTSDTYIFEQLHSYAFCRNATTGAIVINGQEKFKKDNSVDWSTFDNNKLWANTYSSPGKQKLYGAKLYKKYMNNTAGRNTLAANHAAKLSQLGVNAPLIGTTFDYVKDGLILDLRGETAPTGTDPNRVWPDLSGRGNSPTLDATVIYYLQPTTGLHYYSGTTGETTLRLPKSLGAYKELTIEVVVNCMSATATTQKPVIQFSPNKDGSLRSSVYCNYPDVGYVFEAPCSPPSWKPRVEIPAASLKYAMSGVFQRSCYRRGDKLYASQNGYVYNDFVANVPSDQVAQLVNGLIYTDWQHIYAIRIYNRALSDVERQHNYLVDKEKYKILP